MAWLFSCQGFTVAVTPYKEPIWFIFSGHTSRSTIKIKKSNEIFRLARSTLVLKFMVVEVN